MSMRTEPLEVNKCILSKLWYTSLVLYQERNNDKSSSCQNNSDTVDFAGSETLIKSLVHSQNEEENRWIIQTLLQKLIDNVASNVDNVKKQLCYMQMIQALQLCKNLTINLQQELLTVYENSSKQTTSEVFERIHEECFIFLKQNIHNDPTVVCWIINELLFACLNKSTDIAHALQDFNFSLLKDLLEYKLRNDNSLGCALCVISKMNVMNPNTIEFPSWFFPTLLKACNIENIECALYSKADGIFFNEWCNFLNEAYADSKVADNLNSALKIQEILFLSSCTSAPCLNKTKLIQRVTNIKLHWITDILNVCYTLVTNGKYDEVSSVLSCKLLKPFWPVLLIKVLNDYLQEAVTNKIQETNSSLCDAIKFLINKCDFHTSCDMTLHELNTMLNKLVKIVEYVLNWTNECFRMKECNEIQETTKTVSTSQQRIPMKRILNLMQHYNSLSVLKMATNMQEQEYNRIKDLLEDLGESENIFYAYCGMLSALKAILLCETYSANQLTVTSYFSDMKHYMQILHPFSLRIQVIENVFYLLFLRHEDFAQSQKSYDKNSSVMDTQSGPDNKWMEQHLRGFICNKYAVRDILYHLKEIIAITETECMKMRNEDRCAEDVDEIQKRISSISEAIIDAKWRLELYTNSQFVEDISISGDASKSFLPKSKTNILSDGQSASNRFKESTLFYQEGSASDETKIRSDSSSESELINKNTKWRRRSRNLTTTTDVTATRDIVHKPVFVNFMLASKESLVIQCLWKNDYAKGLDIIETSNMKNTQLHGEMQFSKALHTFRKNMYKQVSALKDTNDSTENLESSTLKNIRLVTQEGIQSSRQTSQLETFLASQEMNLRMLTMDTLNSNEILTICVLDVALTISPVYSISNNLCEVAMKYLKLCKTFDNTEYARFFFKIYQSLRENKDELSIENILGDAKISLSMKECKEKDDYWTDIVNKHREFKESQANKNTINKELKDSNYLSGLKLLGKVATISSKSEKYMQNVLSHLQLLHTIIPTEQTVLTVSDLLKISLHYYFGYQIFDLKVEPNKLEAIAHNLQVNLVYSILTNACPKLFYEKYTNVYTVNNKEIGCIILNKTSCKSESSCKVQRPNQCVSEILTELLEVLRNLNSGQCHLSHDDCRAISKHSDVQNVLNKTSSLANLDLSELSTGDETLTFFVNTWNLMFLHASLTIWANDPPLNNLQHTISLMSIGYLIGDLNLVTLAALRSKLVNNIMLDNKYFIQVEELNEPVWQDLDITYDSRLIFLMANEFYGTPCIRICKAESLNEDLSNAFKEYLDYYSSRPGKFIEDIEKQRTILLPDVIKRYQDFVSLNSTNNDDDLFSVDDYIKLSNELFVIQYMAPSYSYEIILKYSNDLNIHRHKQIDQHKTVWRTHTIRSSLLQYLEGHCWIVSYLLQRMHNEDPTILENNCDSLKRTACLENLLNSFWVTEMKFLFENNETLAAILEMMPIQRLWSYFEVALEEDKWHVCLKLINALPDNLIKSIELQCFKDKVLSYIVSSDDPASDIEVLQYLYQIRDVYILSQTVLCNINKWHVNICENALLYAIHHTDSYKLPVHCKFQLNEILHRVQIFHKMLPYCVKNANGTWYDIAYCTENIDPFQVIKSLINADKFELCLEWLECQAFSLEIHPSVTQDFLIGLLKNESPNFKQTLKFLQSLPLNQSVKLCKTVLKTLESIDSLQFICNYLLQYCKATQTIKYRRTLLGIDMLRILEAQEIPVYIHLIQEPLLMLEQLLMNCKLESIQKILSTIEDKLEQVDISRNSFDVIIRFYAQKSLDCRVSLQCESIESKSKSIQHSVSEAESTEFLMPIQVPTKEEWLPNDQARECNCCKTVIFSMFNRRHHCRRCGRVICATCSQHRMHVPGYPASVLVRVCDDCKRQTVLQMRVLQGGPSTASSEMFDYWRLTRDQNHNESLREEFSFEYAPNISLCLAILNLHSDHKTYTSFLFDRCDEMKLLLQPVSDGKVNPEVDHTVIIKMIRSLLVAAKVKCAKLGLSTGLAYCDRFLSQVDLIASLVKSDYLPLIPFDNLDEHALRKLRDLLIEKEQWTLALDVSTKAGLDTQGVWATWGKACLKMGYFDQAREKFFHCFDKIQHDDFDDWVILSCPKEATSSSEVRKSISKGNEATEDKEIKMDELNLKRTEFLKSRPLKDPPLLTEILQILDNLSTFKQYVQYPHQYKPGASHEILNNLGNLRVMSQGQFNVKNASSVMKNVYYHESHYYLLTYGSYNSILEFFLKHEEFSKCLAFTLENDLEPDLFFHAIYLYCLRNGSVERLHDAMKSRDSSLLIWKKYLIYACHSLERRQYLNILYQLQLFTKDSIRAAMTCIRFYLNEATNYTDLYSRENYLLDAQKHLESELQVKTLNRKRRQSTSSIHSNQGILTMEMELSKIDRHINTICRQMEIAKFLANCEKEERPSIQFLNLFPGKDSDNSHTLELPTLFGNQQQKIDLAVLSVLCGCNIEEGFGIAFRVMQDYNLPQQKVYCLAGHILTLKNNVPAIEQLIKCCHTSGISNSYIISDYVLTHCVKLLLNRVHSELETISRNDIDRLIRLITDIELKINAYIESKQLKTAYLLAVKNSRTQDIRKILKEADRLGQNAIKAICMKWLQKEPKS